MAQVWAPLWVARWADDEKLPLWINLSGCVAAGVGNGWGHPAVGGEIGWFKGDLLDLEGTALQILVFNV